MHPNVVLGDGTVVAETCIIGEPPRGKTPGELVTTIGGGGTIRAYAIIYAGVTIGEGFQTGHFAMIREDNILGDGCIVGTNAVLEYGNRVGNNVHIHSGCFMEQVTVEDDVFIGPNVVFADDPRPMGCPRYKECLGGAHVKRFARIGANSTILPGVVIGENCLIGAGSVVVDDVPDNAVVVGSPARQIKEIKDLKCFKGFYEKPYDWAPYNS